MKSIYISTALVLGTLIGLHSPEARAQAIDITNSGNVSASSTFPGYSVGGGVDGSETTDWFSDGCGKFEGSQGANSESYYWSIGQDFKFTQVEIKPESIGGFGFTSAQLIIYDKDDVEVERSEMFTLPGKKVDIDHTFSNSPVGRKLEILLLSHEDCACGGFSELKVLGGEVDMFVWTGKGEDNNWNNPKNWKDKETGEDADHAPGDPQGEGAKESATVVTATVDISAAPVLMNYVTTSGMLLVNNALTLESDSSIENPVINANIATNGELKFSGSDGLWKSGNISGEGKLSIPEGVVLAANPDDGIIVAAKGAFVPLDEDVFNLDLSLDIAGKVVQEKGTLNLDPVKGRISVVSGGTYEIQSGMVVGSGDAIFENDGGTLKVMNTGGTQLATLDIPYNTSNGGKVILTENSSMVMKRGGEHSGNLVFELNPLSELKLIGDHTFTGMPKFIGTGIVKAYRGIFVNGGELSSELSGEGSMILNLGFSDGLQATGGKFVNKGNVEWQTGTISGGTIEGDVVTNGFKNDKGAVFMHPGGLTLSLESGVFDNHGTMELGAKTLLDGTVLMNRTTGTIEIGKEGSIELEQDSAAIFENQGGTIRKKGGGESTIDVVIRSSSGLIEVEEGSLIFDANGTYTESGIFRLGQDSKITLKGNLNTFSGDFKVEAYELKKGGIFAVMSELRVDGGELRVTLGNGNIIDFETTVFEVVDAKITGTGKLFVSGNMLWESGTISLQEFRYFSTSSSPDDPKGTLCLIEGDGTHVLENIKFVNQGVLIQRSRLTLTGTEFINTKFHRTSASVFGDDDSTYKPRGTSKDSGILEIEANANVELNVKAIFKDGEIRLLDNSTLTLRADAVTTKFATSETFMLEGGTYHGGAEVSVGNGANLVIGDPEAQIDTIENGSITITGTGNLHNLTNVSGDLTITSCQLHFIDVTGAAVSGSVNSTTDDFSERGAFWSLENTSLTVGGSYFVVTTPYTVLGKKYIPEVLKIDKNSSLSVGGEFEMDNGTVVLDGLLKCKTFDLDGGVIMGSGTIEVASFLIVGNDEDLVDEFNNSGRVVVGSSPGIFTINGDYNQLKTGELVLELGGSVPGDDYDQLVVNGTATLGGCLRLIWRDESLPGNGTTFTPIVATSLLGQFDEVIFDIASSRQIFDVVMAETGVTASAVTLDVSTFGAWQTGVFSAEEQADENISGLAADPDEDGLTNLLEYALDGNPKIVTQPQVIAEFGYDDDGEPQIVMVDFPWANGMTDVRYGLEYSTDLETWSPLSSELTGTEDLGLVSRITLSADLPVEIDSRMFVRLLVSEI